MLNPIQKAKEWLRGEHQDIPVKDLVEALLGRLGGFESGDDLIPIDEALAIAQQCSPMPARAHAALKTLRAALRQPDRVPEGRTSRSEAMTAERAVLWCLHIEGPDDVHAAPSKVYAEAAALIFNDRFASVSAETGVMCRAVVAEWPHSPKSHAERVGQFALNWLVPQRDLAAIHSQSSAAPAAPSEEVPVAARPEDHDYECRCCHCGATFYGHKRDVTCAACRKPAATAPSAEVPQ